MEISIVSPIATAKTPTTNFSSSSTLVIHNNTNIYHTNHKRATSNGITDQNKINVEQNSEDTVNIPTSYNTNTNTEQVIFTGGRSSSRIELNRTECTSAVTETVSSSEKDFHVLKIQISPENKVKDHQELSEKNENNDNQLLLNQNQTFVARDLVVDTNSVQVHDNNNTKNNNDHVKRCKISVISLGSDGNATSPSVKQTSSVILNCGGSDNDIISEQNKSRIIINNTKNLEKIFDRNLENGQTLLINSNNNSFDGIEVDQSYNSTNNLSQVLQISSNSTLPETHLTQIATTPKASEMVQKPSGDLEVTNPTYLYYMMTSGQCSPSDTLDSGTCSDMENNITTGNTNGSTNENGTGSPPLLPKKMTPKLKMHLKSTKLMMQEQNGGGNHNRTGSFTDSEESESSLSCDSLNSSEFARNNILYSLQTSPPPPPLPPIGNLVINQEDNLKSKIPFLPDSLLRDIRDRKFNKGTIITAQPAIVVDTDTYENRFKTKIVNNLQNVEENDPEDDEETYHNLQNRDKNKTRVLITQDSEEISTFDTDKYYKFHINERDNDQFEHEDTKPSILRDDESFAGYKDIHSGTSTIRSSKGTIRGVKNRVRNGIATFLQMQQPNIKNYKEKDSGKVVLYTTSMGIVRQTYAKCFNVKQILRTLLIKFEERDVFMSSDYQQEIKERMQMEEINVPQLFVEGQHIGDAEAVERLNESGELRKMLKPYKSLNSSQTCQTCGGYRLLPCPSCNGSKKSVHRNHFTAEFVALKCMNCDEVGLVKCHNC